MKENAPTPETVKTPPPLTPKDSVAVEVEERAEQVVHSMGQILAVWDPKTGQGDAVMVQSNRRELYNNVVRIFKPIVDELRKERDESNIGYRSAMDALLTQAQVQTQERQQLATAQAQLRRKDEALEKIHDCEKYLKHPSECLAHATDGDACDCGKDAIMCLTRDALADGKEGGK